MIFINALPSAIALGLIWGIMAIGVYITYKILDFADLTVDGSICTGGAVCAVLVANGMNIWFAIIIAFLAGCLTGLITGVFHTLFGIPGILAGILTQLMLYSINLKIIGAANISLSARTYKTIITQLNVAPALLILFAFVIAIIGILYLFFGTEFGASIRATGCNEKMATAQGINTNITKIVALMLSNGIVALSGAMLAQYQGFADINMGRGAIVIGLASIIIGMAVVSLLPKKINTNFAVCLAGAALGGIIYYIVYQLVVTLGLDTDLLKMLSALVVALFLGIPYWKRTVSEKKPLSKKSSGGAK